MLNFIKYKMDKKLIKKDLIEDEEGRAIIDITIKDRSEVLSPFISDNKETINNEFANFLDNAVKSVPPKQKLHIKVSCKDITQSDKKIFENAIKNYYLNSALESERKLNNNIKIFFLMLLFSAVSLTALFLMNYFSVHWLIAEVFDIITWVFIWEAVDLLAFQRSMIRYEKLRYLSLYECKISINE